MVAVGPDAAGLDAAAHAEGHVHVAAPDAGAQAELGVVGDGQGFRFVLEGGDGDHRAEDFFLEHAHFVVALEQRGLDVIALAVVAFQGFLVAAGEELGAFAAGHFHVGHDLVELLLGGLGTHLHVGVQGVAAFNGFGALEHHGHELVVHVLLDQRPGRAGADFALVEERQHQAFHRFADEFRLRLHDVGEVDVGGFAAQLHGGGNDVFRRAFEDVRAHRGGAGEGDLGDALAGGQGLAGFLAVAVDDVEHALGEQVADDFHQLEDRRRGLLGGLEHHAVAGGQRRRQLPGGHQDREVPGDDLPHHAQRLVEVIGHGVGVDVRGGAFLGADAAGEVAEVVHRQGDVGVEGFAHRFAVVPGFRHRQGFQVLLDAVGDLEQQVAALGGGGFAPGGRRAVGGVQRQVDVLGGGAGNLAEHPAVHRADVVEVLAFDGRDPLAADVVFVAFVEGDHRAFAAGIVIDHVGTPRGVYFLEVSADAGWAECYFGTRKPLI